MKQFSVEKEALQNELSKVSLEKDFFRGFPFVAEEAR